MIFAYLYSDPLLESPPDAGIWGVECDRVFRDLGNRTQLHTLLQTCEDTPPDYLLLRRLEELGETLEQVSQHLSHLEGKDIEIITTEQSYTSSHPTFLQLLSEIQREQRRRRLRRGHAKNRIKRLPPPGKAPYGYRRGKERYILDRSTAPLVKAFFERYLLFGSLREAVGYLEKKYGKKISVTTGQRWLTNVVYRGDLQYQNGEVIANTHIPILTREEAAQIDRLLRRNRRLPPRTASASHSLTGLVVCQHCDSSMRITRTTSRGKGKDYCYVRPVSCPNRPKCKGIPYETLLNRTVYTICQTLPQAVSQQPGTDLGAVRGGIMAQIGEKQVICQQVADLHQQGILDATTADLRQYQLQTEMAQLQEKLSQLPPENLGAIAQTVSLPQFWFDLSEAERRFYFREFLKQIQIVRQNTKDWTVQLIFIFNS
ncbi:recombinase family protein [Spirulina sp. CS-785/01]|uniref:recombinase family protein n=1 Tax=Spirulina sp. CS-785/01 TaxID=3021716 RepID=UPI00232C58CD|nr:recombinase family protein [Spirulina sp. CS-785/01]MDB9313173.1 recombinase family protein [Spirulina sp. CS-785/01]